MPITFTHPLPVGADLLHNDAPPSPKARPPGINVGLLNIRDGRDSNLGLACRCFEQANLDLIVVAETKIQDDIYPKRVLDMISSALNPSPTREGLLW